MRSLERLKLLTRVLVWFLIPCCNGHALPGAIETFRFGFAIDCAGQVATDMRSVERLKRYDVAVEVRVIVALQRTCAL